MNFEKNWTLYLLLWVGLLMGFLFLGIAPVFQKMDMLSQEKKTLQQEVVVLQRKIKELEALEAQLESLRGVVKTLEGRIPNEKEIPNLLLTIEDASFLAKTEILSLVPQEIQSRKNYSELPLQVSLRASFPDFLFLLNYLRQSPRLIQVKGFNFRKDKDGFLVEANLATYLLSTVSEKEKNP